MAAGSLGAQARVYRPGLLTAAFLVGYAIIRFALEFTRMPDVQLGFVLGTLTMGQLLSAVMLVTGLALLIFIRARPARFRVLVLRTGRVRA